jgi:hypothetical protein
MKKVGCVGIMQSLFKGVTFMHIDSQYTGTILSEEYSNKYLEPHGSYLDKSI